MIAIIDYGMGNIHSVRKAIESMGAQVKVVDKPEGLAGCEKAVLPGVGAFGDAAEELEKQGLIKGLKDYIASGRAFLGICLGLHLLLEESEESPGIKGLGLIRGRVEKFAAAKGLKVPHMGWNQLDIRQSACPLFKGLPADAYVYFCHSYYPAPKDSGVVAATTEYGRKFASLVWKDNIYGAQFHPEKSQKAGLKILENFVKLC